MLTRTTSLLLLLVLAACSNQGKPVGFTPDDAGTDAAVLPPDTIVVDAGEMRDSGLSWDASSPDSSLFGDLYEDNTFDPNDPCDNSFPWPPADALHNILMETGDYVTENGHLYQYIGTQPVDWPLPDCAPSNPTMAHCNNGQWWLDTGMECPGA